MTQRTFSIIKPNAVKKNAIGAIYQRLENAGFKIIAAKMCHLSKEQAGGFYQEHQGRPYFDALVDFMTSGPVMLQVLEGDNVIAAYRELMGATDPEKAAPGTLRADFADSMRENAVHGSDSEASAEREIAYFFDKNEIFSR